MPAPPQKQPGADADTPPQRIATGRAISSNQSSAGDAVVARAVLRDLTATAAVAAAASRSTAAGMHASSIKLGVGEEDGRGERPLVAKA